MLLIVDDNSLLKAEIKFLADFLENEKYYTELRNHRDCNKLTLWEKFWNDWSVIRTIPGKDRDYRYRQNLFITIIQQKPNSADELAKAIDKIASDNPVSRTNSSAGCPTSLVSKSVFMLYPDKLPPFDSYANKTLESWAKYENIIKNSSIGKYQDYFDLFIKFRKKKEDEINQFLTGSIYQTKYFNDYINKALSDANIDSKEFIMLRMIDKLLWQYWKSHKKAKKKTPIPPSH